jgi:hypothetical protein
MWPGGAHWLSNLAITRILENWRHRGTNRDRMPSLLKRAHGRRSRAKGIEPTKYAVRQKRSQRSEAEARFLIFALQHCDFGYWDEDGHHMAVGVWDEQARSLARPYTLMELGRATNLKRPSQRYEGKVRSSCRLDRAIRVVGRDCAAYVYRHQRRPRRAGGGHVGRPAQMFLTFALFEELGIPRADVDRAITEARQERAAKAEKPQHAPSAPRVADLVAGTVAQLEPRTKHNVLEVDLPQFQRLQWEIGAAHRDWSVDQVSDEAARRLQRSRPPPDRR